ncbi:MAG: N-acetylmuramoyl-L-alanine amidase, partial [Anaerolineae bacterium]
MKATTLGLVFLSALAAALWLPAAPAAAQQPQPAPSQPAAASRAGDPAGLEICFYRNGDPVAVARPGALSGAPQQDAQQLLRALLAGPGAQERDSGLISGLPPGSELAGVTVAADRATVDLRIPLAFLQYELDAHLSDAIVEQVVKTLYPLALNHFVIRAEDERGEFVPLSDFLPAVSVPAPGVPANQDVVTGEELERVGQPPAWGQGQPSGALSGKTVWLSAGHGWYWSSTLNSWRTQRGNHYGLVEDFSNAEAVNYYLARYLWNAGADVQLVRERGMSPHEIIVDNDQGPPAYVETGSWLTGSTTGYQGGTYRYDTSMTTLLSTATWTPDLPAAGWYPVWVWYRHGDNRTTDARYQVHHAGGLTTVSLSQEVHGQTWRYLGEYYFEAGTAGHVTLLCESSDPGQAVVADAVRFGSGLGSVAEPGGTSGEPRWEEAAKYWARYQGAPPEVYESDVTARPRYAEWESAKGYPGEAENAVYISWHTNGYNGEIVGTESYIHSTEPTTGSVQLQDHVHAELIADIRAAWDPSWTNRGQKSADLGELRDLEIIPGVLLEVAFHDSADAQALLEPSFRQLAARAVYQGIVKYHAQRQGTAAHLLPEPPQRLVARNSAPGEITLQWAPPACCDGVVGDAATGYRVYHSADGRGFSDAIETTETSLVLTGLEPRSLHFFRVTATNQGGESFPSPVVAVRTPIPGGSAPALIVDGSDRLDSAALIPQWESSALGTAQRMFLERMNRYDYAVEHGSALATCSLAFDGAVNEAVEAGDLLLSSYQLVDWFSGEDAAADASLSDGERAALAAYLQAGGGLLISGAEIGWDLVGDGRDPAFYSDYLQAAYQGDDAGTYTFAGVPGGIFDGLAGRFDDSTLGSYDVGYPDLLDATAQSSVVLRYTGGSTSATGA